MTMTLERLKEKLRKAGAWLVLDGPTYAFLTFMIIGLVWSVGDIVYNLIVAPAETLTGLLAVVLGVGIIAGLLAIRLAFEYIVKNLTRWAKAVRGEEKKE